jgi:hypothetical protein
MFRKEITGLRHDFFNSFKVMEDIVPQNIGCLVGYSPFIARAIGLLQFCMGLLFNLKLRFVVLKIPRIYFGKNSWRHYTKRQLNHFA